MRPREELIKVMLEHLEKELTTGLCLFNNVLLKRALITHAEYQEIDSMISNNDPRPDNYWDDPEGEDLRCGYYFKRGDVYSRRKYLNKLLTKYKRNFK